MTDLSTACLNIEGMSQHVQKAPWQKLRDLFILDIQKIFVQY